MIKKIEITTNEQPQTELEKAILRVFNGVATKLNEIIDAVNTIQKEREAERFEIKEWIDILEAVRKSVNTHEKQIDKLQMKLEPEKCEIPVDPYAEQRKWIGKACWFWDGGAKTRAFGKLNQVDTEYNDAPFQTNFGQWYEHCEPVKPDDDIIYKGDNNE